MAAPSKFKIGLVSLGCAKNLVDSENLLACFPKESYEITLRPDEADLIIVNTCGFIDAAKKEAVETILEMANYDAKLVVTGCLLYRDLDEIKKSLPEVDLFVPLSEYPRFGELVAGLLERPVGEIDPLKREISTVLPFAYMKISEGCSNYCAFCAIPYIRGPYRSRPMDELLEEGRILFSKGVRELALVSQDPMHYGVDLPDRPKMVDLLKGLSEIGFPSIRLLYLYPEEIDDEFLLYVKDNPAIEKYFDIPIQSGSDEVLRKMNRKDSRESMRRLFSRIRALMPKASLRTTLIAGFSGESEENHRETLSFIKEIGFDHLGVFPYSREEGTMGYAIRPVVPHATRERRAKEIMEEQRRISIDLLKKRVGERMDAYVLAGENGKYSLRSYWNAPDDIDGKIYLDCDHPLKRGDRVRVEIDSSFVYDLHAKLLKVL